MAQPPLSLVITLKGTPRSLLRGRHLPGRRRPVSLTGKARVYAQALQRAAQEAVSNIGPDVVQREFAGHGLRLSILWHFPTRRPERWGTPHTQKPDSDNCEKLATDCLQRAGALGGDDCKVAEVITRKEWAASGMVAIRVDLISNTTPTDAMGPAATLRAPPGWLK